jgi:hypothetical protein
MKTGYVVVSAPSTPPPPGSGQTTTPPTDTLATPAATPDQGVAAVQRHSTAPRTTAAAKAPVLRVKVLRLSGGRVRLVGTLAASVRTSRVTVKIHTRSGRWMTAHPAVRWSSHARPRFSLVVKRRSVATRWRLILTGTDGAGERLRSLSRIVVLGRRAALRRAT